jgi:hypothetical protein
LRLKQRFSGHLLLATGFSALNDPFSFIFDPFDDAFKTANKVFPVLISDSTSNLITTRVVWQL